MSSSEETRNRYLGYEALIRATGTFFRLLGIFGVFLGIILILGSAALEQAGESFGVLVDRQRQPISGLSAP